MDTKWKKYSHSWIVKLLLFIIVVLSFSFGLTVFIDGMMSVDGDLDILFENSYFASYEYANEVRMITNELNSFSEAGTSIDKGNLSGVEYYLNKGTKEYFSEKGADQDFIKSLPAWLVLTEGSVKIYPENAAGKNYYYLIETNLNQLKNDGDILYLGFTEDFLKPLSTDWQYRKDIIKATIYELTILLMVFFVSFVLLLIITGRKYLGDKEVSLNFTDKIYTEFNLAICGALIGLWFSLMIMVDQSEFYYLIFPITLFIAALGLIFVLSLFRHFKNRTFLKHSLTYIIFNKLFKFVGNIYNSGTTGHKVVFLVVIYPIITAVSLILFPLTIAAAVWLSLKKVQEFNTIKEGLEKVKSGDLHHKIEINGKGELAKLADDINSITEGLKNAVKNELKSQRLKTELITNVSHDIRTPLTSIINFVDLLRNEEDPEKITEYVMILQQKSERLKTLTDDLFEASKVSSGNIPVNFERVDIVSLITQGLGEYNDRIQEARLDFKSDFSDEKIFVRADGKLLWRSLENLLSNIFKYALNDSRVYINAQLINNKAVLTIKNISAYELNISSEELMERFTRGDESRGSDGSGLGLSIAKSLIEIQEGTFKIEIDGDLFKTIIELERME